MADDEQNQDIEDDVESLDDEDEGKSGGKKKLIIIAAILLLLGGGGAGAYFMGYLDSVLGVESSEEDHGEDGDHGDDDHGDEDKKAEKDDGHGGDKKKSGDTAFLALPTMTVNLNTEDGVPRFLRLTVQLELEDPSEKEDVEAVIPRVIDQFQTYLRELRMRDLRGTAGIYRLQMELLWRVNQAVEPIEVKDVLFQEILIQ